jgi:hypothetical protein
MEPIDIHVRALVADAVKGIDLVNRKVEDQERQIHSLAKAQHDLETSALKLADAQRALAKNTDPTKQHDLEGAVLDARVALDSQQKEVDDLARSYAGFGEQTERTKLSITDIKSAIDLTTQGLGVLRQGFDLTIGKAIAWGGSMGDLAALTGDTVENTSRLAAVWELVGGDVDTLGRVVKSMTKEGLQLNYDTLIKLNKEYNAIQDPVKRNEFLFKNFGRSAEDVAEIMTRTSDELEELSRIADKSGKVIGEDTAARMETLEVMLNVTKQQVEGLGIVIGGELVDVLHDAVDQLDAWDEAGRDVDEMLGLQHSSLWDLVGGPLRDYRDALDEATAKTKAVEDATSSATGYVDAYSRSSAIAATEIRTMRDAQADLNVAVGELQTIIGGKLGPEQEKYYETQGALADQARDLKSQIDELKETDGKYYQQVRSNGMTAAEVALANEKLAKAQRELAEASDPLRIAQLNVEIEKQQKAISGASELVSGYVDNSKKIEELEEEYNAITGKIEENREAHQEATARIVFGFIMQKAAAEGFKNLSITELAEIGKAWGIYDETTADALAAVDKAVSEHGATAESVINAVGSAIIALPTEKSFTYRVIVDNPSNLSLGSEDFGGAGESGASPVTPIVPTPETQNKPVAGGGFARGGSFTVPGSGSGDRPYLVSLTPGERVDVTPIGKRQSGDGTMIKIEKGAIVINGDGKTARAVAEEVMTEVAAKARALSAAGRQHTRG